MSTCYNEVVDSYANALVLVEEEGRKRAAHWKRAFEAFEKQIAMSEQKASEDIAQLMRETLEALHLAKANSDEELSAIREKIIRQRDEYVMAYNAIAYGTMVDA